MRPSGRRHCSDPDLHRLWRADERTQTAHLLIMSELFLLDEQPALHHFDLRSVYWSSTKVQAGTICVHVLSNTSK